MTDTTTAPPAAISEAPAAAPLVGQSIRRVEDVRLTTGLGRFIDDIDAPGALHMRFVRSPHARARITGIELGRWEEAPRGTVLVTGEEIGDRGIRAAGSHASWQSADQPLIAVDEARYVGEPVAVVLHEDPYLVEDAAEAVAVDYEPLTPIVDLAQALDPSSEKVHSHWENNYFARRVRTFGDLDKARAAAYTVVRRVTRNHRQAGVPLENRGCVAIPDPAGRGVTLWSSTQVPHLVRTYIARELEISEHSVQVVAPDVGGGFGVKGHVFGEEVLVALLAMRLGRAVKWIEDRAEHLIASIHARDQLHLLEAHVDKKGKILGLRAQAVVDAGAYSVFPWTAGSDSGMFGKVLLGPYAVPNYQVEDIPVATNKCPLGTYRGVGRPGAVYAMERLMDEIALTLDLDPAEVRRANVVKEFPYHAVNGLVYDPGSYEESLDLALTASGYHERDGNTGKRTAGRVRRGYGISLFNEQSAHGTKDFATRGGPIETGYESVAVRVEPDGQVLVLTGLQSHGQAMETTLAQIVGDDLGVPLSHIRVIHGDTRNSPYAVGTWGSRGAALGGGAAAKAARQLREKILAIGAHQLDVPADTVTITDAFVHLTKDPGTRISLGEIAYIAHRMPNRLPDGMDPALSAEAYMDGPGTGSFSNACHVAVVDVDTATGGVSLARYVVVEDCGTVINPMVVEGQTHGGVAQGIGTALLEESTYSADGQPTAATFMDYLMPSMTTVPHIETYHLETPSPWTERGIKGMGESGAIGPVAAIANAVADALGTSVVETPMRPRRVWELARHGVDHDALWRQWATHPGLAEYWT